MVQERRQILTNIRKIRDELHELTQNVTHNDHVRAEMEREIKRFFQSETPDLLAYKGLKEILQDGTGINTRMNNRKHELFAALKEHEKHLVYFEAQIQSMKVHLKGRGKVISLEGKRSQKAHS
jgi:hypothetical protein